MGPSFSAPTRQAEQEAVFSQYWEFPHCTEWMLKVVSSAAGGCFQVSGSYVLGFS